MSTFVMIGALLLFFGLSFFLSDHRWMPYIAGLCALAFVVFAFLDPTDRYVHLLFALFGAYAAKQSWERQQEENVSAWGD